MTVLVTGATGTVGREVVADLLAHGTRVRALTRHPEQADLPDGVETVGGELLDRDALRAALDGVEGLFLLSPVAADELTGTLQALDLADRAGVRAITYLSVIHADTFTDPAHFAAKAAAERMIAERELPATILRPGYYMQNDLGERERMLEQGVYASPLGATGVLAVDTRDLGELGSVTLRRRLEAEPQPARTLDAVAPELLTGDSVAELWATALGRPVRYAGDDLDAFEETVMQGAPGWMTNDMQMMFHRFQTDGMSTPASTEADLRELLGRPLRTYVDLVAEAAGAWAAE